LNKTGIVQDNTLDDLLYRCALHDAKALSKLYELTSSKLFALCLKIVTRQDIAEDVLQDSFINIWNKADQFRGDKGSALSWMVGIVRNKAIDWIRKNPLGREVSDEILLDKVDFSTSENSFESLGGDVQALINCMDDLDDGQRKAITNVYYQGFTHKEYSNKTGHPLGTIKSWIRRGLQALKQCLEL